CQPRKTHGQRPAHRGSQAPHQQTKRSRLTPQPKLLSPPPHGVLRDVVFLCLAYQPHACSNATAVTCVIVDVKTATRAHSPSKQNGLAYLLNDGVASISDKQFVSC